MAKVPGQAQVSLGPCAVKHKCTSDLSRPGRKLKAVYPRPDHLARPPRPANELEVWGTPEVGGQGGRAAS